MNPSVIVTLGLGMLLAGCPSTSALTTQQLTACAKLLDGALKAGTLSKADAIAADQQMRANPPVLPAQCKGAV